MPPIRALWKRHSQTQTADGPGSSNYHNRARQCSHGNDSGCGVDGPIGDTAITSDTTAISADAPSDIPTSLPPFPTGFDTTLPTSLPLTGSSDLESSIASPPTSGISADTTSTTLPDPTATSAGDSTSSSATVIPISTTSKSNHTAAIAGGVVGGVVGLAVLVLLVFLAIRRHRQRQATRGAPSSEFIHHPAVRARSVTPVAARLLPPQRMDSAQERLYNPGADMVLGGDDEVPPPFSPGSFRDPVLEKADASARYREELHAREAEGDARSPHSLG